MLAPPDQPSITTFLDHVMSLPYARHQDYCTLSLAGHVLFYGSLQLWNVRAVSLDVERCCAGMRYDRIGGMKCRYTHDMVGVGGLLGDSLGCEW